MIIDAFFQPVSGGTYTGPTFGSLPIVASKSYIFSANDVIANAGVILAGFLVAMTGSNYPDLVIGPVVGLIVLNGAQRILSLK